MITCSRCGKENQDHYKFCLGCGNEIKSAAAKPSPASPAPISPRRDAAAPLESGRAGASYSMSGPGSGPAGAGSAAVAALASERTSVGVGADPNVLTPPPTPSASPKPRSGIPWNDSPQMPSVGLPAGRGTGNHSQGHGTPTPSPVAARGTGIEAPRPSSWVSAAAGSGTPGPAPLHGPSTPSSTAALTPTPTVSDGIPAPATVARNLICSNCGRAISPGFAFCGACGTRVSPAPQADAAGRQPHRASAAASAAAAEGAPAVAPRGGLILIRPDGSEGGAHPLHDGENLVGRGQGSVFDGDLYLSPRHAELVLDGDTLVVRDARSLNGIFFRIGGEELLESGDVIRIGQELLRFETISVPAPLEDGTEVAGTPNPGFWGRLSVIAGRDSDGSAFPLFGDFVVMGRERGDILFPEDGYVSGAHAKISTRENRVYLTDVGSSNGTFLRIRGERKLPSGAFLLMGQQLFRVEYR